VDKLFFEQLLQHLSQWGETLLGKLNTPNLVGVWSISLKACLGIIVLWGAVWLFMHASQKLVIWLKVLIKISIVVAGTLTLIVGIQISWQWFKINLYPCFAHGFPCRPSTPVNIEPPKKSPESTPAKKCPSKPKPKPKEHHCSTP
jgi:hypothetical protein